MEILEKVEKIREKTGVTYEEAKNALEASNNDILDAIVLLENQGKINGPKMQVYTTAAQDSSDEFQEAAKADQMKSEKKHNGAIKSFLNWCKKMIKKGCENFFIVERGNDHIGTVPVIVLIVLVLAAFWVVVPLMIIGLFFGFRYSFQGEITKAVDVNTACEKAAEAAENVKNEFTKKSDNTSDNKNQ